MATVSLYGSPFGGIPRNWKPTSCSKIWIALFPLGLFPLRGDP